MRRIFLAFALLAFSWLYSDAPIYSTDLMETYVPSQFLYHPNLKVRHREKKNITDWNSSEIRESFAHLKKVIFYFKEHGSKDYMIFASSDESAWEILPYFPNDWSTFKQLLIFHNVLSGPKTRPGSLEQEENLAQGYRAEWPQMVVDGDTLTSIDSKEDDPFCDPAALSKQRVFEGEQVDILYNYAPLPIKPKELDFLIIPKKHRLHFTDLAEEEYVEAMVLAQELCNFYREKDGISNMVFYHKTGVRAGQTVPHWHLHVTMGSEKPQKLLQKIDLILRSFYLRKVLSEEELKSRVDQFREELKW
ncbi:MAG: HIT domain-containing protein [Chlamydiae bacterium]|nr:HIT domain-containing protein [Chlamydiota bacterium]